MKAINCKVHRIVYESGNYIVLSCQLHDEKIPTDAVKGYLDGEPLVTVVGNDLPNIKDVEMEVDGQWAVSSYGMQFKAFSYLEKLPTSKETIIRYLCKEITGVGKVTAGQLFQKYGADVFDALDADFIGTMTSVRRFRNKLRLQAMKKEWELKQDSRKLIAKLMRYGIKPQKAVQIRKAFGNLAETVVENDTYQLCGLSGFGFLTVDAIAKQTSGFKPNDPLRIKYAYLHVLKEAETEGHLFLPRDAVLHGYSGAMSNRPGVCALLGKGGYTVPEAEIKHIGNEAAMYGDIRITNGFVYSKENWEREQISAEICHRILTENMAKPKYDIETEISIIEKLQNIRLAGKQRKAVINAVSENMSIITGGPGTGKTTTLKVILSLIHKKEPSKEVLLMAPTGKASKRMSETTGEDANTIDLMVMKKVISDDEEDEELAFEDAEEPLDADYIIVDEMSMTSMSLFYRLLKRVPTKCRVILLGDVDQLSSVGAGNVLRELINSGIIPVTVLDVNYRQQENLSIVKNAQKINSGVRSLVFDKNFVFVEANNEEDCQKICVDIYRTQLAQKGSTDNVVVLSPFKKSSAVSVINMNECLREIANPIDDGKEYRLGGMTIRVNDRMMNLKNKHVYSANEDEHLYISNGDTGFVRQVDEENQTVVIDFDGREALLTADDMKNITLAYSYTVHKSQGSEIPVVILPLMDYMKVMLKRNLLYTAITRAKECVYIVGTKTAVNRAIDTVDTHKRNTMLGLRLKALFDQAKITEFKIRKFRYDIPEIEKKSPEKVPKKKEIEGQLKLNLA